MNEGITREEEVKRRDTCAKALNPIFIAFYHSGILSNVEGLVDMVRFTETVSRICRSFVIPLCI